MKRFIGLAAALLLTSSVHAQVFPQGATPAANAAAGSTGAVTATLAAVANRTNFLCGLTVSAIGGTAAVGPVTVSGLLGGSQVYQMSSTAAGLSLIVPLMPCIPATGVNTAISAATTADGSATAVNVHIWGYLQ